METGWDSTSAEAARLVHGDRQALYDHPIADYTRTAELFAAMTGIELSVTEAIAFMVCMKLSRIGNALDKDFTADMVRDSIVDAAGYLDCLWAVWEIDTAGKIDDALEQLDAELDE